MSAHTDLVKQILREFGSREGIRLWVNNAGAARSSTGQVVRFGVPGQADISGILAPHGRRIEIEAKTGSGRQNKNQRKFQAMIEKHGGLYVLARSVGDVEEVIDGAA